MSGFNLAPLNHTLGIRIGSKVSLINPPSGFVTRLNPLPDGVEFLITAQTGLDVILFFTESELELVERLPALSRAMALTGGIWVFWSRGPKVKHLVTEEFVRHAALDFGLVDNKLCVLDETWTALRLVWRPRAPRPEKPTQREKPPEAQA